MLAWTGPPERHFGTQGGLSDRNEWYELISQSISNAFDLFVKHWPI
jgi:hypothetical protein